VQFLASKVKTEEEFFHTFNALYESGSQLVLTCDRLPRDLEALEDRLRERFEGALIRVVAYASLTCRTVSAPLAREVLGDLYPPRAPAPGGSRDARQTIDRILRLSADTFGFTVDEILSHDRRPALASARQVAMYLAREHTGETLPAI